MNKRSHITIRKFSRSIGKLVATESGAEHPVKVQTFRQNQRKTSFKQWQFWLNYDHIQIL